MRKRLAALAALGASALAAGPVAAGSSSTNLPNGASLDVGITTPVTGDTFLVAPGSTTVDVPVTGNAAVGEGVPNALWIYVVDVSGSTVGPCGATNILACEKQAAGNLNDAVVADGSASEVGVVVFSTGGAAADMSAAGGDQTVNDPASAEVDTVIGSIDFGVVNQFTVKGVGTDSTNYASGLLAATTIASVSSAANKNVVFMSDGLSNDGAGAFDAALDGLVATGATIYPFAVSAGASCNGGAAGTLDQMAAESGTTCTPVPDPADLPDIIVNLTDTTLTDVALEVDGVATALDSINPPLPLDGPDSTDWTATAADQAPGTHEVCAEATGLGPANDPASETTVQHCETYNVFGFDVQPPTATNELGSDQTHTVTATVSGAAGEVDGWPVAFTVLAGPNAGTAGTCNPAACTTDADGKVTFTYTVPVAPSSLGTDTIRATVTIDDEQATIDVTKDWVDTTPPVAACVESVNPDGHIPASPGNGGQHQNPDGFYDGSAIDDVWPEEDLEIYVVDTGTGHVFGPFPSGTDFKWVEANGAQPSQKPGDGEVEWFLKGRGDAEVYAVDGSGNQSDPVSCRVPPAPS